MTTATAAAVDETATGDLRDAARTAYRESIEAGQPLSGKRLGELFGRSERWGRDRIAEAKGKTGNGKRSQAVVPLRTTNGTTATGKPPAPERQTGTATATRRDAPAAAVPAAVRWVTVAAVVLVAAVAAAGSYDHMRHLAAETGQGAMSWLLPLGVDGLMVAASMVMLVRRRRGQTGGWLAWTALVSGVAASLAANVAAAEPTALARAVSAWPPLALLLAYELLMQMVRTDRQENPR